MGGWKLNKHNLSKSILCGMLFVTDKYDSLLRYLIGLKAVFSDNLSILSKISVEKFAQ